MRQVVQGVSGGGVQLAEVPRPTIGPTEVLVVPTRTLLSAGTERAVRRLAMGGLLTKARARPDLVRDVVRKARVEGLGETVRAVRSRLGEDIPLGYAGVGTVLEVGEAVDGVAPGHRVATGGAGHAELQAVAGLLAVPVPEGVGDEEACFATLAAIALHGLRLAELGPGSKVCVVGLGLVGQLTLRLAQAAGHEVAGIDVRPWPVQRAVAAGAVGLLESGDDTTKAVLDWSRGRGADAVLLTAATTSSAPARRAPALARDRATVVVVGDVGLELSRTPFYDKELTLRFARSYGPGRYDTSYEGWAVDYPIGHVRWTERRNLEAYLDLVAARRVHVADLVTHRFPFHEATKAYDLVEQNVEPYLGVMLTYEAPADLGHRPTYSVSPRWSGGEGVGLVGAGMYARSTLVPALREAGFDQLVAVASATGRSAARLAVDAGFETVAADLKEIVGDPRVDVVVVVTPHDSHARYVTDALEAGKHVYCEKPLALSEEELEAVASAWRSGSSQLMVGFNRRYAPAVQAVRRHFGAGGPMVLTYRVSAGQLPPRHWYRDRRQGGRLQGEVCHFIDTCSAVVEARVTSVVAIGSGRSESLLEEDVVVVLRYADGSVATISYAAGGYPGTPKERLEVLGRGHSAVIDDYRRVILDESPLKARVQGKGHRPQLRAFRDAVTGRVPDAAQTEAAFSTTAVTLAAVASLLNGRPEVPREP